MSSGVCRFQPRSIDNIRYFYPLQAKKIISVLPAQQSLRQA
ncbi:Uncharacterised protein [Klebsiella variicola]|nr:Uncharacterised protein [Klebsiella variicola]